MYLVVTGTPSDGFEFIGPFDTPDEASSHADENTDAEWWVATLHAPSEEDG